MAILQGLILGVLFLVELIALYGFGYWGFHTGANVAMRWVLGIGTPLAVAVFWGMFVAPKANFPVSDPVRALLQALVFGLSAWGLFASGKTSFAIIFAAVAAIEVILNYSMKL